MEDRLFAELEREAVDRADDNDPAPLQRYPRANLADPRRWEHNWNRTYVLETVLPTNPTGLAPTFRTALDLAWRSDVCSLSQVAILFPESDAPFGGPAAEPSSGLRIGAAALRGETGALQVPAATMLRQRGNPSYAYVEARIADALEMR